MQVHQILQSKLVPGVATVMPDTTVAQAAAELAARRIGSLVVSGETGAVEGILSERDIVREIGRQGPGVLGQPVEGIMTREVQTCALTDSAHEVLSRMTEGRFRHMPVIDKGRLVALVSIGDVVKARLSELSMEKDALEGMIMGF
ncbi:CBS domain-containing protein [Rhodovulum tesquicola]|uniref:CBS domain-containing protein n=1 Tax=Rhodovulum tesquicola TaxID=540254 RepID=UPI0020978643|nr:CBS domain-containing protein [Rhodovulum tesquicola]MCO8144929.1 CBS domain-containing protein [Rhodovulum tesquicola]